MPERERYVILELEGFLNITSGTRYGGSPGLSVHLCDRAYGYRCVGSWRTEDYGGGREQKRGHCRRMAEKRRAELDASC